MIKVRPLACHSKIRSKHVLPYVVTELFLKIEYHSLLITHKLRKVQLLRSSKLSRDETKLPEIRVESCLLYFGRYNVYLNQILSS